MGTVRGTSVDFDLSSRYLATVRRWGRTMNEPDGEILRMIDVGTGRVCCEHRLPGFEFQVARFSPDGRWLACGIDAWPDHSRNEAVLLNAETGEVCERLRGPFEWVNDFAFLRQCRAIAIAVRGHTLRPLVFWELPNCLFEGGV
jgi:dipeptidyl aminopeptidase/acylaminoacyl peptidase